MKVIFFIHLEDLLCIVLVTRSFTPCMVRG